jgi:hypothetical protein
MLLSLVTWLNQLPFSVWLREMPYPFPIIETVHILALGASFGTILWVDLRLMNVVMRDRRVSDVIGQLEPTAIIGFAAMFLSGSLLFFSEPLKAYMTWAFRVKAVMLVLAGINIWFFHRGIYTTIHQWDRKKALPWQARFTGLSSLLLWLGIIIAGRWTAYF